MTKRITMAAILRHVIKSAEHDCWVWNGSLHKGKIPVMKFNNRSVYPKRAAWVLRNRRAVPAGLCIINTSDKDVCDEPFCINPAHTGPATKGEVQQRTVDTGMMHTPATCAKIAAAKSAVSKLSDAAVLDIRSCIDSAPEAAKKHDITEAYVHMLRRGLFRNVVTGNPFAGLFAGPAVNDSGRKRA